MQERHTSRFARLDGIRSRTSRFYGSSENQLLVVGQLIGHLLSVGIEHYDLCRIGQLQLCRHIIHGDFHHFAGTFYRQRIRNGDSHRTVTAGARITYPSDGKQ